MSDNKDDIGEYSGTSVEEVSFVSIDVTCELFQQKERSSKCL